MISSILRMNRLTPFANKMEFLQCAQAEPCSWKSKCWPRDSVELEHDAIKLAALFHIDNMNGDVIQFVDCHDWNMNGSCSASDDLTRGSCHYSIGPTGAVRLKAYLSSDTGFRLRDVLADAILRKENRRGLLSTPARFLPLRNSPLFKFYTS